MSTITPKEHRFLSFQREYYTAIASSKPLHGDLQTMHCVLNLPADRLDPEKCRSLYRRMFPETKASALSGEIFHSSLKLIWINTMNLQERLHNIKHEFVQEFDLAEKKNNEMERQMTSGFASDFAMASWNWNRFASDLKQNKIAQQNRTERYEKLIAVILQQEIDSLKPLLENGSAWKNDFASMIHSGAFGKYSEFPSFNITFKSDSPPVPGIESANANSTQYYPWATW